MFSIRKYIYYLTIFIFTHTSALAQINIREVGQDLFRDGIKLTQPGPVLSDVEKSAICASTLISGALVYKYDPYLERKILYQNNNKFRNNALHALSKTAYWYGSSSTNVLYTGCIIGAGLLGTGLVTGDTQHYKTARLLGKSAFFTFLITGATKVLLGRERPEVDGSQGAFHFFETKHKYRSMPSGHTAAAFTFATVLAQSYDSYLVSIPAYTLAFCAGLERIERRHHWISDVIVGGTLGFYIGRTLVKENKNENNSQNSPASVSAKTLFRLSIPL